MHIIRMDIDRKHSAEHLQIGPLGCGLNAIFATAPTGSSTMTRFVKGLLFRGHGTNELNYDEYVDAIDGSMQWADATGHVRLMSYSGGSPLMPSRFVHSPLHPSERPIRTEDHDQIRGLGNIFWEGDEYDGRWDDLRGDILGMVFCSPLGSVSPEKLWWAASRLGVHSPAKSEADEGYQRLKAEEQELLDRLRNAEGVDHDRAWWSIERDRIAADLSQVQSANAQAMAKADRCCQPCTSGDSGRLANIQAEIARLRGQQQESVVNEANSQFNENRTDGLRASSTETLFNNVSLHNAAVGKTKWVSNRTEFLAERQRLQNRIDELLIEQKQLESPSRLVSPHPISHSHAKWDDAQLRQQHAHAEEMIRRWDRRAQTHRRLEEVQSHLRTRSPYRRTMEGSLIPVAEKFLRELTSGAARNLPPWAIEASYLSADFDARVPVAHECERNYRRSYYDTTLPSENTRQRKVVDLAIRLAIAQSAVPRIGRIPMMLDDSLNGFRGESLEQILHVLSGFSRDGRQLLVSTSDEYTARRIAAHGGTVTRMLEVLRYAHPNYVLDGQRELGLHPSMEQSANLSTIRDPRPLRIVGVDSPSNDILEMNRQLTGLANEQASGSWWLPSDARMNPRRAPEGQASDSTMAHRRFYLQMESLVQDAPGVTTLLTQRMNAVGIYRVADLLRVHAAKLGATIRVDAAMVEQIQRIAELMCGTPQLRAFDAQVLVGCGIARSDALRSMPAAELVQRVESFLSSGTGQDLLRSASSFEVARIRNWVAEMRRSHGKSGREEVVSIRAERKRDRNRQVRREATYDARPRVVRSSDRSARGGRDDRIAGIEPLDTSYVETTAETRVPRMSASAASSRPSVSRAAVASRTSSGTVSNQWKFYLDIDSPVVDAPSIGPRMAERLAPCGILSVGDLVAAHAESIAAQLADRAVPSDNVKQWQHQALLVCRVPNLRGHDAQLIVGCDVTSAEQLAAADPADLFNKVVRFASSKQGVRILRGSNAPDQAEVSDWIQWAQNCRAVRAA